MMLISRRLFLSLASLPSGQAFCHSLLFFDASSHNITSISPEFLKIYHYWKRIENVEPDRYLEDLGCSNGCGMQLSDFIVDDFTQGRVLIYNGVVASRTEVAVCALYGKWMLA